MPERRFEGIHQPIDATVLLSACFVTNVYTRGNIASAEPLRPTTRKLCYRKDDRAMRPILGEPKSKPKILYTITLSNTVQFFFTVTISRNFQRSSH